VSEQADDTSSHGWSSSDEEGVPSTWFSRHGRVSKATYPERDQEDAIAFGGTYKTDKEFVASSTS